VKSGRTRAVGNETPGLFRHSQSGACVELARRSFAAVSARVEPQIRSIVGVYQYDSDFSNVSIRSAGRAGSGKLQTVADAASDYDNCGTGHQPLPIRR